MRVARFLLLMVLAALPSIAFAADALVMGTTTSIQDSGLGEGNGFTFAGYDADELLHALRRALRGYADEEGWQVLVRRAMACDFGWAKSAGTYIKLYKSLLGANG